MCRLFGMSGGSRAVRATFWLLDAPDSLAAQSAREPDGTGLGWFDDGGARVEKEPVRASEDAPFLREARTRESRTFVAHVRWAYVGAIASQNTQPFVGDGALFVHQGLALDLDRLDAHLGPDLALVDGETDSERIFALIRREARSRGGDWAAGIAAAANWMADELPLFGINLILATERELFALRYPDAQTLFVRERHGTAPVCECEGTCLCVRYDPPAVVIASERLDEDDSVWSPLEAGELVHVDEAMTVQRRIAVDREPAQRVRLEDLDLPEGVEA